MTAKSNFIDWNTLWLWIGSTEHTANCQAQMIKTRLKWACVQRIADGKDY